MLAWRPRIVFKRKEGCLLLIHRFNTLLVHSHWYPVMQSCHSSSSFRVGFILSETPPFLIARIFFKEGCNIRQKIWGVGDVKMGTEDMKTSLWECKEESMGNLKENLMGRLTFKSSNYTSRFFTTRIFWRMLHPFSWRLCPMRELRRLWKNKETKRRTMPGTNLSITLNSCVKFLYGGH